MAQNLFKTEKSILVDMLVPVLGCTGSEQTTPDFISITKGIHPGWSWLQAVVLEKNSLGQHGDLQNLSGIHQQTQLVSLTNTCMADGRSFFRGGTENNTRLSSFPRNQRVKISGLANQQSDPLTRSKAGRDRVGVTTKTKTEDDRPEVNLNMMQNGVGHVGSTGIPTGGQRSCTPEDPHVPADSSASPGSNKSPDKGDILVFTERQLSRLATFLDDSLIKAPTPHKILETDPRRPSTDKVKSFYVEKWPEPTVRLDNTMAPYSRTLPPRRSSSKTKAVLGGEPISVDTAKELRMSISGSCIHSLSLDWKKAGILFQNVTSPFPYGLVTPKIGGGRGIVLAIQGHILQHLLFDSGADFTDLSQLRPSPVKCRSVAVKAVCDMWWRAGCGLESTVCLPQEDSVFTTQTGYREDGITEKLHLFKFNNYDDLESFVKRYFDYFEGDQGCLLFLYSLVLSRGFPRIADDQGTSSGGCQKLLTDTENCTFSLINLMLTGRAVQYLHNGVSLYNEFGHLVPKPLKGVEERCSVGFLYLDKSESRETRTQVGSMLKTPRCPIWLTQVNGMMGILFSTNPELVSHWRVEHRFFLYYYTGQPNQKQQTCLSIDTRFNRRGRIKTALARRDAEDKTPALESCILTKWYDAEISWNGTTPFY
ncbi:inactive ubiquitin carboxyl-terminal hydrolase MINDY-4B-like [Liolophura sinensis]|uniref:inactive ubiquitin carboxyl-terminal hydrolase MINDY-4B-like n=1 Tax=Liolophura sinensis TaxID=3198878 RepID=UPI003158A3D9